MRHSADQSVAVGFFDGVHLGHQAILRGATAAITFRNHPLSVLAPSRAPRLILSPERREAEIRACGVENVRMLEFTRETAAMSAEEFLRTQVLGECGGRARVRCGANWRFGRGGAGDPAFLRREGVPADVADYVTYRGGRISSSRIRECIASGAVEDAAAMMGRRYAMSGTVERGKGRGAGLGFPTVNLRNRDCGVPLVLPPNGVYEVVAAGARAAANWGIAPTMGDQAWTEPVLEIHLPKNFGNPPAPGDELEVEFVRFIRPERRFASLDELKRQITADCAIIGV